MADTEEYFPRGGKKPAIQHFKQSNNFLGAPERREKKKRKSKKKPERDDGYSSDEGPVEVDESIKNCASGLGYKIVKPGVLILGRVREILETKLNISLPCRMLGSVMACHISEEYNKQLEAYVNDETEKVRELSEMFRAGQYVAVKVLEVEKEQLLLSMMPKHVNGGTTYTDLTNGYVLQAAVSSVEDHGYVMDIGISNTRAFLPKKHANPELELGVGMLTWCVVKSVTPWTDSSVVTVSSELEALQQALLRKRPKTPLLPGTTLDFTVDKPLDNGIEGHVFGDTTAYVQRQHADSVRGKKPALGQRIRCRLLYVMPTRNTPFLTMRSIFEETFPDLAAEQKFKDGDIVEDAQVIKITGRAIHFKLGKGSIGKMSLRRIQVDENLTDEEIVANLYPLGSTHKVRVLCYNLADYTYSITDQASVVGEVYFNMEQMKVGDIASGTVKTVSDHYLTVTVGRVTGYVPHAHMSDSGIFVDPKKATMSKLPKKKFKEGQPVSARVLAVDLVKKSLILTLKPSLLAPDLEVLSSYDQAVPKKTYVGVIKHVRDYVLVSFFGGVVCIVPRHFVSREPVENLVDAYHVGQIVNCTIVNVDPAAKKMTGSFITSRDASETFRERKQQKRKATTETEENVPQKKRKSDDDNTDEETEPKSKKKDKKKSSEEVTNKKEKKKKEKSETESGIESEEVHEECVDRKDRKKKKDKQITAEEEDPVPKKDRKRKKDEKKKEEESNAIEADVQYDVEFTPQELELIDLSDCATSKQYKHRVLSLIKAIKAKARRTDRIDEKIKNAEERGLSPRNKKYHTAMHMEKLQIEERTKKLMEVLAIAQEKVKEFDSEPIEFKKKKKVKEELNQITDKDRQNNAEVVKKVKQREIKVVDNLEPVLEVPSAKDFWSANPDDFSKTVEDDPPSSSDDEEKEQPKKKRKKLSVAEKLSKLREEEERLREMERVAVESESQPRSSEQFERALLANPDSSQLWIAYMAFHLQATEIDKARAVGRKALSTINFREELERLNVWLALLNCEHRFGTKESQQKTLEEAVQMNDPYKVHSKLLDILVETGKQQELSTLVDLMMRKYKREPGVYALCGGACFRLGMLEKGRQLMQKAIAVLEKKEHVSILVQFALLERSLGARERAEALFEQVLAVYPQRVDVCATYIDMLVKGGDAEHVRQVMERMTSQKLPARKMKILYKKWIEVEEKIGDQNQVEVIRQRAMEYIEKAKF